MSITLVAWFALFVTLCVLTLTRCSWGVALYLLTYYINPVFWWWGKHIPWIATMQWNLAAALVLGVGVLLDVRRRQVDGTGTSPLVLQLLFVYGINAVAIHLLFANDPHTSYGALVLLWKQLGLLVLLLYAIRDRFDFKVLVYSIVAGALYVGFEVVINGRGDFSEGRLEGLGMANIGDSNYLAGLLCMSLPLAGWLLLCGRWPEKIFALVSLPLIMDTILRCNSRGAFLALIVAAVWLILRSKGRYRKYAFVGVVLGGMCALTLAQDPDIANRFWSIFVSSEERDISAQSRFDLWTQALEMIGDYPLGSGGEAAFKSPRGISYLRDIGRWNRFAVHNGYLDIAAGWGVQALMLYLFAIFLVWRNLKRSTATLHLEDRPRTAFLGVCVEAVLITQMAVAMFISNLDSESFFWWIAMAATFPLVITQTELEEEPVEAYEPSYFDESSPTAVAT